MSYVPFKPSTINCVLFLSNLILDSMTKTILLFSVCLATIGQSIAQTNYTTLANNAMLNHSSPIDFQNPQQGGNATLVPGNQNIFATATDDPWLHPYVQVFKGANGGWDMCMTVDPSQPKPGAGEIDAHLGGREPNSSFPLGGFTDYETKGDLYILGDYLKPYYAGKTNVNDPENDFVYIYRFDENFATIRLHGSPTDYVTATAYNPETQQNGTAIFYIAAGTDDFIGFVDGVDSTLLPLNGVRFQYDIARTNTPVLNIGKQISTGGANVFGRIAIDNNGNIYQTFLTSGSNISGTTGTGSFYLVKYDQNYNILYATRHGSVPDFTTMYGEYPYNIAVSGNNVFISGHTKGDFGGPTIAPTSDKLSVPILCKFDATNGSLLQVKRLYDTTQSSTAWNCLIEPSGNHVFAMGGTTDNGQTGIYPHTNPFIKKLTQSNLTEIWSDTIISGSVTGINPNYQNISIECFAKPTYWDDPTGSDLIWVGGYSSNGNFLGGLQGSTNAWIAKYDTNGNRLWGEAFYSPTGHQYPTAIEHDSLGNVYIIGQTYSSPTNAMGGAVPHGIGDGFIRKYDINGTHLWTKLIGTSASDEVHDLKIIGNTIILTGSTQGNFGGANSGMVDGIIVSMDLNGNIIGSYQFGTPFIEYPRDIYYRNGKIIISGITEGSLVGPYSGGMDVFITEFPESVVNIVLADNSSTSEQNNISVFPNPTKDKVTFKLPGNITSIYQYQLYSATGQLILTERNKNEVDLAKLPNGVYYLTLQTNVGFYNTKLIKE